MMFQGDRDPSAVILRLKIYEVIIYFTTNDSAVSLRPLLEGLCRIGIMVANERHLDLDQPWLFDSNILVLLKKGSLIVVGLTSY